MWTKIMYSLLFLLLTPCFLTAQESLEYQLPPREILEWADAPLPPVLMINRGGTDWILLERSAYASLESLMQEELGLAGLRINPSLFTPSRQNYYTDLKVQKLGENSAQNLEGLPSKVQISQVAWSPNEKYIAFLNTTATDLELWVGDLAQRKAILLQKGGINNTLGTPFVWAPNSEYLLVKERIFNPQDLIAKKNNIPAGPRISQSEGESMENRTYQDLLQDPTDVVNFSRLGHSRIVVLGLQGERKIWPLEGILNRISFSPDGQYVLLSQIQEPFSYLVPYDRFPTQTSVYNVQGDLVKTIEKVPLKERMPKGFMAVIEERRAIQWRKDQAHTLFFVKAQDGGDPKTSVSHRDVLEQWEAPFEGDPSVLIRLQQRYAGVDWGNEGLAVAYDRWYDTRNSKTYLFNPSRPDKEPEILFDRNYQDLYADPGSFVKIKNRFDQEVLFLDKNTLSLIGMGHGPEGPRPFFDRLDLNKKQTKRVWQAENQGEYVSIVTAIDPKKGILLITRESPVDWPNYYLLDIQGKKAAQALTQLDNPFRSLQDVKKEILTYQREDGVELSGTLYLPAGYEPAKEGRLPLILWAYPREYKDKSSAGQITTSPFQFTRPWWGSPLFWVRRGYAILDNAAFPILGEGEQEPNDTFIQQLIANAKAAIDALDQRGIADTERVAVGGHSYGAFMTAHLLTHSNLFAAGIARSGAYNRTLTPFGFQSEQRNYWEAQDLYHTLSPFSNADKMKTPLLLVHGEQDNNSGTFPLQSERYFHALKGLGAPCRLVLLPGESHGYRAKESILHLLWEQDRWLEQFVKNKAVTH
jgi:dipeptidyl aminopeptidase/acylaminoacyl peptidase